MTFNNSFKGFKQQGHSLGRVHSELPIPDSTGKGEETGRRLQSRMYYNCMYYYQSRISGIGIRGRLLKTIDDSDDGRLLMIIDDVLMMKQSNWLMVEGLQFEVLWLDCIVEL